jgi:prepilin-type N-terminal cleavage/methylation domain-containing protein
MKRNAFTLIEVIVVVIAIALFSSVIYRLMTGTFSQFFKSQTRLTNLRSASIILENLKTDLRLAVIPVSEAEKPEIVTTPGATSIKFVISDGEARKMVKYSFEDSMVYRKVEGKPKRPISQSKVADFIIEESEEPDNDYLAFRIIVDKDKDLETRTGTSKGNKVEVRAHLYPRFAASTLSDEEKFWNLARQTAGGS